VNHHKDKNVDRVCRAAQLHFWSEKVWEALHQNELQNDPKRPSCWCQLAKAVARNPEGFTNYTKVFKSLGQDKAPRLPDTNLRHMVAWAIGRDDSELSPNTEEWLAAAARFLVLRFDGDARTALEGRFELYGAYMFRSGVSACRLSDALLCKIAAEFGVRDGADGARQAVLDTASAVGAVLIQLGWKDEHSG
jgi:hypothetical protein